MWHVTPVLALYRLPSFCYCTVCVGVLCCSVRMASESGVTVDELLIAAYSRSSSDTIVGRFDSAQLPTGAQLTCNVNTRLFGL